MNCPKCDALLAKMAEALRPFAEMAATKMIEDALSFRPHHAPMVVSRAKSAISGLPDGRISSEAFDQAREALAEYEAGKENA